MAQTKIVGALAALLVGILLMPVTARAQNTGIGGVVRDTSGGVLPGVTVEASSPALIEKVRTVVTDGQGLYSIIDLRPGTYTVTFSLPGFATVRREGIELAGAFMATVNAELSIGTLEQVITVSGEAPAVDTRNVIQQRVMTVEVREALPSMRSALGMGELIPGITSTSVLYATGHDVAGITETRGASNIHGSRTADYQLQLDGSQMDQGGSAGGQIWAPIPSEVQEYVYETGALSAESMGGGVRANVIPKEGGNRFTGFAFGAGTNLDLQSGNLTQRLIDLGVPTPNKYLKSYEVDLSIGGPIMRDRLWFYTANRYWGADQEVVGMYEMLDVRSFVFDPRLGAAGNVDLNRPAVFQQWNRAYSTRLTWQATPRNKFAVYFNNAPRNTNGVFTSGTASWETGGRQIHTPNRGTQASWKSPITTKILIEAAATDNYQYGHRKRPLPHSGRAASPGYGDPDIVGVTDLGTGYSYRSRVASPYMLSYANHPTTRVKVSYVTGAHVAKFGFGYEWGYSAGREQQRNNQNMNFTFQNGVPIQLTQFNEPYDNRTNFNKWIVFGQEQWTVNRFTLNAGVRLDVHRGNVDGDWQTSGPNSLAPFQRWPQIDDVPNWRDISPRLGVAYDLFGTGRTAVKASVSRYVVTDGTGFQGLVNPLFFNQSANRPWTDRDGDFVPDCDLSLPTANGECGTLSNTAFATAATTRRVDDAYRDGWHVRQYQWEYAAAVQHELLPQLSAEVAWSRRSFKNFTVTDNRAISPADYDEFCITAPTDTRLGSVSGTRICGLYDLNPAARVRRPDELITTADTFGTQTESWQGIDVNFSARRLPYGLRMSGGVSVGPTANNTSACFVVDSPQLQFCDVKRDWLINGKFLSSVELPFGINAAVTFMTIPGPEILANFTVRNAQIGSVVQFLNPARTTFSGGTATVPLKEPGKDFNDTLNQVDIRLAKTFRAGSIFGSSIRGRVTLDIGNLFNASAIQAHNNAYGTSWLRPSYILQGRVIKPGVSLEF